MEQAPWLALWPGLCLTIVVYCFNMLGDAMRDLLDPQAQGRRTVEADIRGCPIRPFSPGGRRLG